MRPKIPATWILVISTIMVVALGWVLFLRLSPPGAPMQKVSVATAPASPLPEVAIQDGKTIDFSSGKPVLKNSPEEQAAIDAAVKEIDAATKGVIFNPTATPATEKSAAESAGNPPKP
jgi:hypothetical protein